MVGLAWWVQTRWIDRQRRAWREHDAKLAAAWRDGGEGAVIVLDGTHDGAVGIDGVIAVDNVTALNNVIVLPEAGSQAGARSS